MIFFHFFLDFDPLILDVILFFLDVLINFCILFLRPVGLFGCIRTVFYFILSGRFISCSD